VLSLLESAAPTTAYAIRLDLATMRVLDVILLVAGGLGGGYALASIIGMALAIRHVPALAETRALPLTMRRWGRC
jgi:hypothetical protein